MTAAFPGWMAASAVGEVRRLLRGGKPAARIAVGSHASELRRWARRVGLFVSSDAEGYATLSPRPSTARRAIDLDRRAGRHTQALGLLLGYPRCCSRAAARVGDEGIDARHTAVAARRFHGRYRAIDPSGYSDGAALLSHVPCSHRCAASLRLALDDAGRPIRRSGTDAAKSPRRRVSARCGPHPDRAD